MKVKVANGEQLQCNTELSGLKWWISGHTFTSDMKVIDLGGYDAILGMDWLSQWGAMTCHWEEKWLQFVKQGQQVKLQGIVEKQQTEIQAITMDQMLKWQKGNDIWATAVLSPSLETENHAVPECISKTLADFADVFADPKHLPPHRVSDHAISLQPNSAPVNVRPYRYNPQQKDEIERQVNEMLASGLIKPSMSPFASPVLLVRKKDGTWRFCIDYRRLNT